MPANSCLLLAHFAHLMPFAANKCPPLHAKRPPPLCYRTLTTRSSAFKRFVPPLATLRYLLLPRPPFVSSRPPSTCLLGAPRPPLLHLHPRKSCDVWHGTDHEYPPGLTSDEHDYVRHHHHLVSSLDRLLPLLVTRLLRLASLPLGRFAPLPLFDDYVTSLLHGRLLISTCDPNHSLHSLRFRPHRGIELSSSLRPTIAPPPSLFVRPPVQH